MVHFLSTKIDKKGLVLWNPLESREFPSLAIDIWPRAMPFFWPHILCLLAFESILWRESGGDDPHQRNFHVASQINVLCEDFGWGNFEIVAL